MVEEFALLCVVCVWEVAKGIAGVILGVHTLAVVLVTYTSKSFLRTLRGCSGTWTLGHTTPQWPSAPRGDRRATMPRVKKSIKIPVR